MRLPLWIAAVVLLFPATLQAQTVKPGMESVKDQARKLAEEGERLFEAGDFREAVQRLEEADAKFAAPTIELLCARAHEKLGELVEARALYARVSEAPLAGAAPKAFVDARSEAAAAVTRLDAAIPRLVLTAGVQSADISLTLDDKALSAPWDRPIPLNPGKHTLVVETPGRPAETRTISFKEGETRRITIQSAKAEAAAPAPPPPPAPPLTTQAASRSYTAPAVAFGLGAAGVITGAVAGGLAMSRIADFRDRCGPALQCPPSFQGELDGARLAGHVSTIGFAVAGAGAAMGAALLVWPMASGKAPVSVGVGPFGATVTGRF